MADNTDLYKMMEHSAIRTKQALTAYSVHIYEYSGLATGKTSADPSTWDWTPAIQAACDHLRQTFIESGQRTGPFQLVFSTGMYHVTSKITASPFVKFRAEGFVIFDTNVPDDSAFHFTPFADDPTDNTTIFGKQQWFRSPFIGM